MPKKSETNTDSAFKNWINSDVVSTIANEISRYHPSFNKKSFLKISKNLNSLELKGRVLLITSELHKHLPNDYVTSLNIIHTVIKSEKLQGFALWPFSEFIGQHGLNHYDESIKVMYDLTSRFTAEFCIRPFFNNNPTKVLLYFSKWSKDKNVHIRRWVSEGSRPLLPWGQRINHFRKDPSLTLPLLEALKYDDELYVRKSVANHLNDISKDHPNRVIKTLKGWQKDCPKEHLAKINWIKRHALRTLIKKGDLQALKLMGVHGPAEISISSIQIKKKNLKIGDSLDFTFEVKSKSKKKQKLVIDYSIHFLKKNGTLSPKVFKLKTLELAPHVSTQINKKHSLKKITTMVYNSGKHKVAIHVNGKVLQQLEFNFKT